MRKMRKVKEETRYTCEVDKDEYAVLIGIAKGKTLIEASNEWNYNKQKMIAVLYPQGVLAAQTKIERHAGSPIRYHDMAIEDFKVQMVKEHPRLKKTKKTVDFDPGKNKPGGERILWVTDRTNPEKSRRQPVHPVAVRAYAKVKEEDGTIRSHKIPHLVYVDYNDFVKMQSQS